MFLSDPIPTQYPFHLVSILTFLATASALARALLMAGLPD